MQPTDLPQNANALAPIQPQSIQPTPFHSELVIYHYGDKKVIFPRQTTYDRAVSIAREYFNISGNITLETVLQGGTELYEISPEAWGAVCPWLSVVFMRVATDFPGVDGPGISHGAIRIWKRCGTTSGRDRIVKVISLSIKTPTGKFDILNFIGSDPISKIFDDYSSRSGIPKCQVKLFFFGQEIVKDGMTLHESGLRDGTVLTMVPELRGGKPVIYLYPPTAVDVSVKLSLVPAWEYSAIYPLAVIKKVELAKGQVGQQIEWNVHANPSGLLQDKVSEKDISYLFWEAETCANPSQAPSTPPPSRSNSPTLNSHLAERRAFDPTSPQVTPDNSILLPTHKIPSYLDDALAVLGLHTEARTSFITYWLPSIMKHPHVALHFLPQESYEVAAPMEVTPRPDVVTRIFMVARGLDNEEVQREQWAEASLRASRPVEIWQGIVGMSLERASDPTIFRVLEWGGMFVN